jgi:hypothetical protein
MLARREHYITPPRKARLEGLADARCPLALFYHVAATFSPCVFLAPFLLLNVPVLQIKALVPPQGGLTRVKHPGGAESAAPH